MDESKGYWSCHFIVANPKGGVTTRTSRVSTLGQAESDFHSFLITCIREGIDITNIQVSMIMRLPNDVK